MKNVIWVVLFLSWMQVAYAIKVKSIYEAEVPVRSQDELQRDQAIKQAFIQTLSKMSGNADVLQNPVVQLALPAAKNQVEEFGYVSSGIAATPFLLKVQFDAKAMKKLLRQAKEPIWDENRPLILVWLSVTNGGHASEVIDNQSSNEYALLLKTEALQKGLPILLPVMDIAELNQVSAADIRAQSVELLQKVTTRYHADGMLIGSIEPQDKMITGHWKLIVGQQQWYWDLRCETAPLLAQLLTNKMVGVLAGHYATVQTEKVASAVTLVVKGVAQQDDFENLMRFIKHISQVKGMEVENVLGDAVVLHLDVQGTQQVFMQEAAVGQHLKLELEKDGELTYLWAR